VNCYLTEEDEAVNNACYWIPFKIHLVDFIDREDEVDAAIKTEGERLFNDPDMQNIFKAIEIGVKIETPGEVI
jgi:hypothetical protein